MSVRYPSWALPSDDSTLLVSFNSVAEAQLAALEVSRRDHVGRCCIAMQCLR